MAAFSKFNAFVEAMALKKHNLGTDVLKVMLTLTAPVAANAVKADLTEIAAGNGYAAGGTQAIITSCVQTAGVLKLILQDVLFTAAGGSIANFRYAVLYNDTAINDELIGFYDSGATQTITVGNSFLVDFDPATGVLTDT